MDGTLDITTSQELQSIAGVDGQGGILRLNPLPLVRVRVANLERSDGLTEQESEGAEVCGCGSGQYENLIDPYDGERVRAYPCVQNPSSKVSHSALACTSSISCNGSDTAFD
jgi:hypothetical protein